MDKLVSQPRIKMDCEAQELILQELKEQRELLDEFRSEMAGLSTFEMVRNDHPAHLTPFCDDGWRRVLQTVI